MLLSAGYYFVRHVYLDQLFGLDNEIELIKKKNMKINLILASDKDLRTKINKQKNSIQRNKIFLAGNKPAAAVSELENIVKRLIATNSKGKILAIKPLAIVEHSEFSEASLEITISGIDHLGLQKALYMIENKSPVLLIKELDIKSIQRRYTSIVKSEKKKEQLGVSVVVSGFFRESSGA